jgi:hypothetical protein
LEIVEADERHIQQERFKRLAKKRIVEEEEEIAPMPSRKQILDDMALERRRKKNPFIEDEAEEDPEEDPQPGSPENEELEHLIREDEENQRMNSGILVREGQYNGHHDFKVMSIILTSFRFGSKYFGVPDGWVGVNGRGTAADSSIESSGSGTGFDSGHSGTITFTFADTTPTILPQTGESSTTFGRRITERNDHDREDLRSSGSFEEESDQRKGDLGGSSSREEDDEMGDRYFLVNILSDVSFFLSSDRYLPGSIGNIKRSCGTFWSFINRRG